MIRILERNLQTGPGGRGARRPPIPGFHVGLAAFLTVVVVLGFWPFYDGLLRGRVDVPPLIVVHAAVFSGWLILLLVQTWLVYRRRVAAHQRVGRVGVVYGGGLVLLGLVTAFAAPTMSVRRGVMTVDEAAGFLLLTIGDMILVGSLFIAGVQARRSRERHRRLMILAAIALIYPGVARFAHPAGPWAVLGLWLLPLAIAMAHDFRVDGRVHRIYWAGLGIFLVAFSRLAVMDTELWLPVGRWLIHAMVGAY